MVDGGGMKILSQLWLLKEFMHRIGEDLKNYDENYGDVDPSWEPKPCEYFVRPPPPHS